MNILVFWLACALLWVVLRCLAMRLMRISGLGHYLDTQQELWQREDRRVREVELEQRRIRERNDIEEWDRRHEERDGRLFDLKSEVDVFRISRLEQHMQDLEDKVNGTYVKPARHGRD